MLLLLGSVAESRWRFVVTTSWCLRSSRFAKQLRVVTRTRARPPLRIINRALWIVLANAWRRWRTALMIVRPDTVVR